MTEDTTSQRKARINAAETSAMRATLKTGMLDIADDVARAQTAIDNEQYRSAVLVLNKIKENADYYAAEIESEFFGEIPACDCSAKARMNTVTIEYSNAQSYGFRFMAEAHLDGARYMGFGDTALQAKERLLKKLNDIPTPSEIPPPETVSL